MKHLLKNKGKRIIAALLCGVMCVCAMPLSAFAFTAEAGKTVDAYYGDLYVGSDGDYYRSPDSYQVIRYDSNGGQSVESHTGGGKRTKLMIKDSSGERQILCIESGVEYGAYQSYTSKSGKNSSYFQNLPYSAQYGIMLASLYGWAPGRSIPVSGCNEDDFAIATQTLFWEYQQLLRVSPSSRTTNSFGIDKDTYYNGIKGRPAEKCYNWILEQMSKHQTVPSFASNQKASAQTYTLKYDSATKKYSLTLTDTNNTLEDIKFTDADITVTRSGNKYTFTSSKMIESAVSITAQKKISQVTGDLLVWGCPGMQTMCSGAEDPVYFYLNINTETTGVGHIVKHAEDGKVDGIKFTITGDGVNKTVTTKSDGTVDIELMPGVYTVTEETIDKYEPQNAQRVTIVSGGTSTVTFNNTLKRGDLKVTKTSEDGLNKGVKFHLYGTSLSGLAVNEYAVTDQNGAATFSDVLVGTGYTLEEVDTAIRYVVPEKQTAAIEWKKVTEKSFDNILKKWQLTVTKSDAETGTAQGNASLAGAAYGIYKGEQLIDRYTTDANGQFTTKYYVCGDDWSLREISASEGYLVNPEALHIGAEPKLYTVEYNSTALDSDETVKKGNIALIKHCDDGSTQIETPETGAEFAVYLKSSGSYDTAKNSERDYLVCDENGFAQTKDLPYGIYTVRQTKGWDGNELMKPFDVFIRSNGETYRYLINNAVFESFIKVIKTDSTTGKTIPYAGAAFQIYDPSGSLVTMTYTYPKITTIDTFYTTEEGMLITPEKLTFGYGYTLVEVSAPYGYVLDSTPIPFNVTEDNSTEESTVTIIKVEKQNTPQMGTITVEKSGEVFSSVVEADGRSQPVYAVSGLAGAVYEITAAEDIITPDGTLRAAKGEIVDTVTTGATGTATSKELFLGKYEIREIKAPYGMTVNNEPQTAELTYAGQEVSVTETSAGFYNERQRVTIDLAKVMEKNETFNVGNADEILSVQFGLFTAEDITASDGSTIPADGLIEIVNCDENGNAVFTTDIPVDATLYVRELATNEQYILSEEKYPVNFEYAGQDAAIVSISVNDGNAIENDIIYGNIKGLKIDRETEEVIAGALFGLFRTDTEEFTENTAILTAESGEDGVFTFEKIPYGNWIIKELKPAEGYLPNEERYPVTVAENEEIIEITVVNDRIPKIGTTATVDGEKEICATEIFTLTDTVEYKHLIPGKAYVLDGVLMDKSTGKSLLIDGEEVHTQTVFTPDEPCGKVTAEFTFDAKFIKTDTDIVVFESLSKDGIELAVHANIDDEGQTVKVKVPEIGTQAGIGGKKEVTAKGEITIEDTVSYKNLTPGKEYIISGILMNKATGEPFLVDGKEICSEVTFTPEASDGEIKAAFTFNADGLTTATEIVVFESLCRDGVEIAVHADIEDEGQTVKLTPPAPPVPQTGDNSNLGFWIGLGAVALGGLISCGIIFLKKKKDDNDE